MESIEAYTTEERTFAITTTLFGALALAISMIGIFGLMSYNVSRRTKEIGIRVALGAQRGSLLRAVLQETLFFVVIGVAIGVSAALALTRFIRSMLYGLSPHDPTTIVFVAALMLVMAAIAGYLPARRASRVDPIAALREE